MFTLYHQEKQKFPLKVWLKKPEELEEKCLDQALNLANLPFVHQWVALMPDTHLGKGMPIGGVIALKDVVIPNAVGVDIGCGMAYVQTDLSAKVLKETLIKDEKLINLLVNDTLRNIPVGTMHHKHRQSCLALDRAEESKLSFAPELFYTIENGYYQVGTLGGGNHFIELQEDEAGLLGIMIHSGSRNFGHEIGRYFNQIAKELSKSWDQIIPYEYNLPYLPFAHPAGQAYLAWMQLALDFARENRHQMMQKVMALLAKWVAQGAQLKVEFEEIIDCHHNYAALEEHYGEHVWVHRKGATRACQGEIGIIPGAMGAASYLVKGKGNPESFCSSSHGAGRRYSRSGAMKQFEAKNVLEDLRKQGVILGKRSYKDVAEESRFAYKDIDQVLADEVDLVQPLKRLKTLGVVKG